MNILVADDDPIARKVLRAFLEKAGYHVQTVEDGSAALKVLLSPESPPVALVDWMMPEMSGPEVCGKLRSANLKIRPYIMILSSKSDRVDMVAGLDSGADDFLSKPFNGMEMLARLRVAERTSQYQHELHKSIDESHPLDLAGCPARFTLVRQPCAIRAKTPGQLNELDILAEAFPPSIEGGIPLLSRGSVLNDRYIAKLTAFCADAAEGQTVATFEPSALARHFYARMLASV